VTAYEYKSALARRRHDQEKWEALQRKFDPLGVTFEREEFAPVRCLRCAAVLVGWTYYCDSCLRNSDAGLWKTSKSKKLVPGQQNDFAWCRNKRRRYCSPNFAPEFIEYVRNVGNGTLRLQE